MAELRESSLLFSLRDLYEEQERRVERDQLRLQEQTRQRAQAIAEQERRRIEAERRRADAEEQRRLLEQTQKAEEQARLEGIRTAELERMQREVDHVASLRKTAILHDHEQKMAALTHDRALWRLRVINGLLGVVCLTLLLGGAGAYYGAIKPKQLHLAQIHDAKLHSAASRIATLSDQKRALETRLLAQRKPALEASPTAPAPPKKQAAEVDKTIDLRRGYPRNATPPSSPKCRWDGGPNDPLNPCL